MVFFQQRMDFLSWGHDMADGGVVVHGVDDESHEFTHIRSNEIRFFFYAWREVSQVSGDDTADVSSFVIVVKFFKAIGEEAEGGADKYASCTSFLDLFCNIQHTFSGRDHIVDDDDILSSDVIP